MSDFTKSPDRGAVSDTATGAAIVRSEQEAKHAVQRISGKPRNEEVYWCMSCGFAEDPNDNTRVKFPKGLTLQFGDDEIEALGGDLSNYTGPCPCCEFMTLVPMDRFTGGTIREMARENRQAEYREQAQVLVNVVKQEIAGGGIFDGGLAPGQHDDLPDAGEVDDSELKPRGGS